MSEYKQTQRPSGGEEVHDEELPTESATDTDVDDILDEIDGVLEENAQAFVAGFVQKGGQ